MGKKLELGVLQFLQARFRPHLENFSIINIPFRYGRGLVEKNQVFEELGFLPFQTQSAQKSSHAFFGEVALPIHDELKVVGAAEPGFLSEVTVGEERFQLL